MLIDVPDTKGLSWMERSVQGLLAQDYTGAEIAKIMGVSFRYVRKIRLRLRTKRNQGTLIAEPGYHRNQGTAIVVPGCRNPIGTVSDNAQASDSSPVSSSSPKSKRTPKRGTGGETPEFITFYSAYPRHVARAAAEKAYERAARNGTTHAQIMAGVARYAEKVRRESTDPKYVAHPASWLNAARWLDEDDKRDDGYRMLKVPEEFRV